MSARHFDYIAEIDGPQSRIVARRRTLAKGGGGEGTYYANANELYGEQAATARFMRGLGEQYLPDAVDTYARAGDKYFDPGYAARMAGEAGTTAQQAIDSSKATLTRDMARYGINPASGRWGSMMNASAMSGAATKAGAINDARNRVEDKQFGVAKDIYSSLVGMPSESAAAAGQAASGFAQMGAQQQSANNQAAANRSSSISNIASLGYEAFFAADGGEVDVSKEPALRRISREIWDAGERFYNKGKAKPEHLGSGTAAGAARALRDRKSANERALREAGAYANGGEVYSPVKMAMGGLFKMPEAPAVPQAPIQPQQQQGVAPNRSAFKTAKLMKDGPSAAADKLNAAGGRGMERLGGFLGNEQLAAEGIGKQAAASGTDMSGAINAYKEAGMTDVSAALSKGAGMDAATGLTAASEQAAMLAAQDAALGEGAAALTTEALAGGVEAAGAAALEGTAAGAAAVEAGAAGLTGALGTAAAAIPWIGAAVAIGSMFDLFNEGGEVNGRKDYTPGGTVTGPGDGSTTSDLVPAWLTDGEFVVNAEAVAMGENREKLKKMNAAGLAARHGVKGGTK